MRLAGPTRLDGVGTRFGFPLACGVSRLGDPVDTRIRPYHDRRTIQIESGLRQDCLHCE
jgi:hypothetical protein